MGVIRAHKGMLFKRCQIAGKSAHSSLIDQGVNAITVADSGESHTYTPSSMRMKSE